jgi:hypothetical protein
MMRNNRGEWEYREPYDKDNFEFVRNSGAKSWEFEAKRVYFWDEAKWLVIAVAFTVAFSCALSFALGYLVGE